MREVRIYQPGIYETGQLLTLSEEASHHVGVVLRMQPGGQLTLFCGDNNEFEACIASVKKKTVVVTIGSVKELNRESPLSIHLAQAISKGERMEMVIQKTVELGVASITPLITERCVFKLDNERMSKKIQQWQSIAIAACEQSGRNTVPVVNHPLTLADYLKEEQSELKFVLHPKNSASWRHYAMNSSQMALLIGPEGGLTEDEVAQARQHDFMPLSLGPRILRTETAAITALSILQAVGGDL